MTTQLMNAVKAHGRALLNGHTEEFANKVACAMMGILPTKSVLSELATVANFEDTPPELRLKARWSFLYHNEKHIRSIEEQYATTLDEAMIAALDRELGEDGNFCANCGIPHQIHGDECGQEFGPCLSEELDMSDEYPSTLDIPFECDFGDDCEDYDQDAVFEDHMTDALGTPDHYGLDEPVEVKLSDTPVGQLADNWREAEMAKAKAIDDHRAAGDAFRKAMAAFTDNDEQSSTRVIHESTLEEVEQALEEFEFIPGAFGVSTEPKLLRAIDLPTTEDYSRVQQWFETHEAMNQFLAGRCLFSDLTGGIRDESANIVGMWYVAVFNCGNRG